MEIAAARPSHRRLPAVAAAAAFLAFACLKKSGHSPAPRPDDCTLSPAIPAGQPFTVAGTATYDFVPATYDPGTGAGGLLFAAAEARPIREAVVEVRQCNAALGATTTDAAGHYSVTFTPGAIGRIVVAVLARTASPPIQVQDNTDGGAVWAVGQPLESATATLDVHATHGWTGSSYDPSRRIAAPFAILDSIFTAARRLLALRPVAFDAAALRVNWSPDNVPVEGNPAVGQIGVTHYDPSTREISVLGKAGIDTDEFDDEVIVHEWGHYFTDGFSRDDSIGGAHGLGDRLDPRVSWSEGFASAFAAMLLQQRVYADTFWRAGAMDAFGWDVETAPSPTDDPSPGPFSEFSVIRSLWDLYDSTAEGTSEAWDGIALGLGPIYDTLVGPQRSTPALTTIASFVAGLKAQGGVDAAAVDAVLAHHGVGAITSEFGDGDTALRAMYAPIAAPTATAAPIPVTFDGRFHYNEQPQNQYYLFTGTGARVVVTTACTSDVDLLAYDDGTLVALALSPSGNETIKDAAGTAGFATTAGHTYVVVLTGWGGLSSNQTGVTSYPATITFQAQ